MEFGQRLKNSWNAFKSKDEWDFSKTSLSSDFGVGFGARPDRVRMNVRNERSIVTSVYNQIALDVASVDLIHARMDEQGRFEDKIKSGLQNCLELEANKDQDAQSFIQDLVISMFDEGVVAVVPVDTSVNPAESAGYDIQTMRVGRILEWFPDHVRIEVYNDRKGSKEEVYLPKKAVAIINNPLYAVINEPNSTMQRLMRKLALLDSMDEMLSSGKLDMIIQLPYVIKTEQRRQEAEKRRTDIEMQLKGSQYGIAYTDGTEKITQLNRPVENNLLNQVKYLTEQLYAQLGLDATIFNGTADEKTMLNYHSRTVRPILEAITLNYKRTFLSKTARSQGQSIVYIRNPFELVPVSDMAEMADKFTRNEILTTNEIRSALGYKPAKDPGADELRNKNLNIAGSRTDPAMGANDPNASFDPDNVPELDGTSPPEGEPA